MPNSENIITFKIVIVLLLSSILLSCAQRSEPAPVTSVYRGTSIHDFKANTLKQQKYRVKKGETLYSIAFRAGTDFRELAKLNNINPPYTLFPDQVILLSKTPVSINKTKKHKKTPQIPKRSNKKSTVTVAKPLRQEYVVNTEIVNKKLTPSRDNNKNIIWQWPTSGKILTRFSTAEFGNKGLDISGKKGNPIYAAANGKVVYAGNALRGYGNLIIIKHNEDYLSAYAHNNRLLIKEQQWVKAGQQIAEMGKSDSDKVKLHFEVRYKGNTVDPLKYLPRKR